MRNLQTPVAILLAAFVSAGCASAPGAPLAAPQRVADAGLGPGDVFEVRVFAEPDLSGAYRVDSRGDIDFPLIGRVGVAGRLAGDVADILRLRLATYVRRPQVTVFVREVNSKRITVYGQVQRPGTFPYADSMTVSQAISLAGGLTSMASAGKARITRIDGDVQRVLVVDLQAIAEGRAVNVTLLQGDEIYVPAWSL
jgi:protein involved in polysaccharide export with SLBB domain